MSLNMPMINTIMEAIRAQVRAVLQNLIRCLSRHIDDIGADFPDANIRTGNIRAECLCCVRNTGDSLDEPSTPP